MYSFRDCLASEVKTEAYIAGSFLICRDTGDMYYDNLEGSRITLGKTIHEVVDATLDTELFGDEGHFYYSTKDKTVAVYHNDKMNPINISILDYVRCGVCVAPNNNVELVVSTTKEFKGMADDTGVAKVIGSIIGIIPRSLDITLSLKDLESEFAGKVSMATAITETNGVKIAVLNSHETMQWIGNVAATLFVIPNYMKEEEKTYTLPEQSQEPEPDPEGPEESAE